MKACICTKGYLCLISFILALTCLPCSAATASKTMEEIVVTAGKSESAVSRVPSAVSLIYGQDMEISGIKTVAEYLHLVPGLHLNDAEGNGSQIMMTMRGMPTTNSNYILVLLDGIPQSTATAQVRWTTIPMETVDRIEVVRGPGSALYGMNAMGGVINIITKAPAQKFSAAAGVGYGSYDENNQTIEVSGTRGSTGYLMSARRFSCDGWRERNNTNMNANIFGKLTHNFSDRLSLIANLGFASWDNDWPDLIPEPDYDQGIREKVYYDSNETGSQPDASLILNWDASPKVHLTNRLYGQALDQDRSEIINTFDEEVDASGFGNELQVELNHDLLGWANKLVAGLHFEFSQSELARRYSNLFPNAAKRGVKFREIESARQVLAAYAHDTFTLSPRLDLSAGLRFDQVSLEYENLLTGSGKESSDFNHLSPTLGLTFRAMDNLALFANVGTGFKAPSARLITRNPGIKPEKLTSYELGMKATISHRLSFQATCYTSEFTDQIGEVQDPNDPTGFRLTNQENLK